MERNDDFAALTLFCFSLFFKPPGGPTYVPKSNKKNRWGGGGATDLMVLALGPGAALALMCSGPGAKPFPLARMKWIPQRPPWWIPRGGLLGIPWWTTPGTRQGTPRGRPLRRYRIPGPARGAAPRALGSEQSDQPHPAEQCSIEDSTARTHQRGQNVQNKTKLWVGMELSALTYSAAEDPVSTTAS